MAAKLLQTILTSIQQHYIFNDNKKRVKIPLATKTEVMLKSDLQCGLFFQILWFNQLHHRNMQKMYFPFSELTFLLHTNKTMLHPIQEREQKRNIRGINTIFSSTYFISSKVFNFRK